MNRAAVGGLIGLMLLAGAPASSSVVSARRPLIEGRLAAVTTIMSDAPSRIRVRLDSPATVENPLAGESGLVVRGHGRFVGFALVEVTPRGPGQVLVGGRLPQTAGGEMFVVEAGFVSDATVPSYDLHEGVYDLYLLPGKGPAEVTLPLEGLSGRSFLEPTHEVELRTSDFDRVEGGAGDNVFAAVASGRVHKDGLLFQAAWLSNKGHIATNYDACLWRGEAKMPWALLPRCGDNALYESEGGRAVHGTTDYGTSMGEDLRLYYGAWVASEVAARGGVFGQSFAVHSASAIDRVDSLGIWLNF